RLAQRLDRTLHVTLDQDVERLLLLALAHLGDDVLEPVALADHPRLAPLELALLRHFAGQPLVLDADEVVAGLRHAGQTEHLHRDRRAGFGDLLAGLVYERAHAAIFDAADDEITLAQRTLLHQYRRDGTATTVQTGFDHHAGSAAVGHGLQFHHFGLHRDRIEQILDAHAGLGRHRHELHVAAPVFRHHFLRHQTLLDVVGVGTVLVHLVDRHDHRHLGGTGVLDRLDRLRLYAIVCRHHQDHDIGRLRTTGAHRGERGMAGRVQEGDHALRRFHVIRTDVLGDAARFAGGDLGAADVVEQRGLAVIDVTHDRHHRRAGDLLALQLGALGMRCQGVLGVVLVVGHRRMTEFLDHQHGGVMIDGLVDGRHHAHLEQRLDHFRTLHRHLLRQVGDDVGLTHHDFTYHRRRGSREAMRAGGNAGATAREYLAPATASGLAALAAGRTTCAIGFAQMHLATGETLAAVALLLAAGVLVALARMLRLGARGVARHCRRCHHRLGRCRHRLDRLFAFARLMDTRQDHAQLALIHALDGGRVVLARFSRLLAQRTFPHGWRVVHNALVHGRGFHSGLLRLMLALLLIECALLSFQLAAPFRIEPLAIFLLALLFGFLQLAYGIL